MESEPFSPHFLSPLESITATANDRPRTRHLTFVSNNRGYVRTLSAKDAARNRQPIFTDTERQHMSNEVLKSVPDQDSAQALLEIERLDCLGTPNTAFSFFKGPFGISRFGTDPIADQSTLQTDEDITVYQSDHTIETGESLDCTDIFSDLIADIFEFPDQDHDQGYDLQFGDLIPASAAVEIEPFHSLSDYCVAIFSHESEAWSILSHYEEKIVPLISPLGFGQQASWVKLVMPCAVSTLGDLTSSLSIDHSRIALLNAVLSTSAFHLANHSNLDIEYWTTKGESYLSRAEYHFLKCFKTLTIQAYKTAKYKDILMTILSLSTAYMIKGNSEQRLSSLIQAEKFIYNSGFKKSKLSPKRRTLHHCYAYMRIMAETTTITDDLSANLSNTSLSDSNNEMMYSDFRIYPNITFSDDILAMEKDPTIAQRDLHLAIPGRWSLTLFPEIYGIAESFLMLLSQVIRLANERDIPIRRENETGMLNLRDFWVRTKALEKAIRVLLVSSKTDSIHSSQDDGQIGIGNPRTQAMYTALLIFFHRRIYDLNPALLQSEVTAVRRFLEEIQRNELGKSDNMATLIWPAFIAACEAVQVETQRFFSSWFESCFTATGLKNASMAKNIIGIIWAKRQETGLDGEICSWPDVLRATKLRLMCT
ncbi:uncharacterized protein N7483_000171 [Penicillium malachiteum]|uniref:uncharacterized protein n=1 Tax=Penicillium malachiteum TaxID=1324776 RepID=UPI0025475A49|nr:uncharacterized protein N7483_000171 [Penicillium malachiteum]KAJ5735046.1 hypothetical protein N7483_000171 [Penicillium malachiteum]